jgi:hypothetical protein
MTTITPESLVTSETIDFINGASAVIGFMTEVPTPGMLAALRRLDYGSHICVVPDKLTAWEDSFDDWVDTEVPGIAEVGGYAVDSLPQRFKAFKRMFNGLTYALDGKNPWETSFLISVKITEHEVTPVAGIEGDFWSKWGRFIPLEHTQFRFDEFVRFCEFRRIR